MTKRVDVDEQDMLLFRQSVGQVRPIQHDFVISTTEKPRPRPLQRQADERQTLMEMALGVAETEYPETGEELYFKRDGVQSRLFQKLKRGHIVVEQVLDLHGMTISIADYHLRDFLADARLANRRCVRIIHGKGRGSRQGRAVLKGKVNHWLQHRDDVLAFCSARPVDGGTGAVYVLLKKDRR